MQVKVDIAIIGAGVVGLAIAYELTRYTHKTVVVLEKHPSYGRETSSRNSQVIHSGVYYPSHLLKTQLCITGRQRLYDFCLKNRVAHANIGKLVVAASSEEEMHLQELYQQAEANGVEVSFLSPREIARREPSLRVKEALLVPDSGIVDVHELMQRLYFYGKDQGAVFAFASQLVGLEFNGQEYTLFTTRDEFRADIIINSAGLGSGAVASLSGLDTDEYSYRIYPCKGEYYRLNRSFDLKHLVYPLPGVSGLLGIHITPDISGCLRLGPNAYDVDSLDYAIDDRYHEVFFQSVQRFLPGLSSRDIAPDFAGIRPRRQPLGQPLQDFAICEESHKGLPGMVNLLGIESPGLTSSLAIGEYVRQLVS